MALELTTTRRRVPLSETTFVTRVPDYVQTYLGQVHYGRRGEVEREMMGFGALDATISTSALQTLLRRAGYCQTGPVDDLWGPNTESALARFAMDQTRSARAGGRSDVRDYRSGADWSAEPRSGMVRIDSALLGKLRLAASGEVDRCPTGSSREPRTGGSSAREETTVLYDRDSGGGIFSSPLLWLGVAAALGVGYLAYRQASKADEEEMMMLPPRL